MVEEFSYSLSYNTRIWVWFMDPNTDQFLLRFSSDVEEWCLDNLNYKPRTVYLPNLMEDPFLIGKAFFKTENDRLSFILRWSGNNNFY